MRKNKLKILFIGLLFILGFGYYLANEKAKGYGYTGAIDVVKTYFHNKDLSKKVSAKVLNIEIDKGDWEFIKTKRQIALDRGIQINEGDKYVPCALDVAGEKVSGEIRLKGHMTDHLMSDKWSFRIKAKDSIMGMYRFSIQHPGTRNYVYEWIYHQLLKSEGVIYLIYDFIDVNINGNNLGIYAMEEHFGQHVLERNNRQKGAILRWNPTLYWDWRIDELQGNFIDEQYSHFSSSYAEPYDKGTVKKDSFLLNNYQIGASLLESFRRGEKITSEVFDVEKMARFHVIIDLVGGYHSLDWSDVKFYYNGLTERIEPVGYESFSIRPTTKIAGQRVPNNFEKLKFNYHDQLFSDPIFFESYIKNLERIVSEAYLNAFFKAIQPELDEKMGLIAKEWAYRKVSFEGYYENVRLIRNNISIPKPFHAFLKEAGEDSLEISLTPVSDFPIQIIGIKRKNKFIALDSVINIPAKARNTYTHYFNYTLKKSFKKATNLFLVAKIPGSSFPFEVELNEFPSYKYETKEEMGIAPIEKNVLADTTLTKIGNEWYFNTKAIDLDKKILIPAAVTLTIYPFQTLKIHGDGQFLVQGELVIQGKSKENPLKIKNEKSIPIHVIKGKFQAENVSFTGEGSIVAEESQLIFHHCLFYDKSTDLIAATRSNVYLNNCLSGGLTSLGQFDECEVLVNECTFKNGNKLLYSNGSFLQFSKNRIENFKSIATLDYASIFKTFNSEFSGNDTLFLMRKGSVYNDIASNFDNNLLGLVLWNDPKFMGDAQFSFYKSNTKGIKKITSKI
nr:CotH kinase family protein [Putridiphycobacter roseus]